MDVMEPVSHIINEKNNDCHPLRRNTPTHMAIDKEGLCSADKYTFVGYIKQLSKRTI